MKSRDDIATNSETRRRTPVKKYVNKSTWNPPKIWEGPP
jgi:hypothetical protein